MVIKQTHQKRWFVSVVSVQGAADERLEFNRAALYCRKVAFTGVSLYSTRLVSHRECWRSRKRSCPERTRMFVQPAVPDVSLAELQ